MTITKVNLHSHFIIFLFVYYSKYKPLTFLRYLHIIIDASTEKILRASLKSEVERNLDNETIVILDSMNYIKGYRYE